MSFTDLGKATGLSTSAVHQRVKRLESKGLITGYAALVDHEQLGRPLTAFISITPDRPRPSPTTTPSGCVEHPRDRVLLVGRGGGVLHPQDPGRHPARPRGPARPHPLGRQRLHPHHDRALHGVREPPAGLRGARLRRSPRCSGDVCRCAGRCIGQQASRSASKWGSGGASHDASLEDRADPAGRAPPAGAARPTPMRMHVHPVSLQMSSSRFFSRMRYSSRVSPVPAEPRVLAPSRRTRGRRRARARRSPARADHLAVLVADLDLGLGPRQVRLPAEVGRARLAAATRERGSAQSEDQPGGEAVAASGSRSRVPRRELAVVGEPAMRSSASTVTSADSTDATVVISSAPASGVVTRHAVDQRRVVARRALARVVDDAGLAPAAACRRCG